MKSDKPNQNGNEEQEKLKTQKGHKPQNSP
jgi:hypothetical protein